MAFETTLGDVLAVGFRSGEVRILHANTLQDMMTFKHSGDAVTSLKFSPSGIYLAGYDESHCTLLFKRCYTIILLIFLSFSPTINNHNCSLLYLT
jgi:WD40 repeat protein